MVLITHEMEAVKEICNKVAVMDDGEIIERGDLVSIFSRPEKPLTQDFINTATQINQALEKIYKQARTLGLTTINSWFNSSTWGQHRRTADYRPVQTVRRGV